MLPYSRLFDQRTLSLMVEHDAIVQRYRALFALIDWQVLPDPVPDPSRPGKRPHHTPVEEGQELPIVLGHWIMLHQASHRLLVKGRRIW